MSTATAITIHVNDAARTVPAGTALVDVLRELGLVERKGVAVALNGTVVPRAEWPTQSLAEGSHVLVIKATQGG